MSSTRPNGSKRTEAAALSSPLGSYPEQFLKHMQQLHYSADSRWQYKRGLAALEVKMKAHHVEVADLNVKVAVNLISNPSQPAVQSKYDRLILRRFIEFLIGAGAVTSPEAVEEAGGRESLKRSYEEFLRARGV